MTQYDFGTINPNTNSGIDLAGQLNSWRDAQNSNHKGSSRPSYATSGMTWVDDTGNPNIWYFFDGTDDIKIGEVDTSSNVFKADIAKSTSAENIAGTSVTTFPTVSGVNEIIDNFANTQKYKYGLTLSIAADADHDITISPGVAKSSDNSRDIVLSSSLTKQIDAAWSAGNNAGGLFSGTVAASTWYYAFVIVNDTTGAVDAGFDTSVVAANRPAGYSYRRVGSFYTEGSANIVGFHQVGNHFYFPSELDYSAGGSRALSTLVVSTPPGLRVTPLLESSISMSAAGGAAIFVTSGDNSSFKFRMSAENITSRVDFGINTVVHTNTSSQIYLEVLQASGTVSSATLNTLGWIDYFQD